MFQVFVIISKILKKFHLIQYKLVMEQHSQQGKGTLKITTQTLDGIHNWSLANTFYIPNLDLTLISCALMAKPNYTIVHKTRSSYADICTILKWLLFQSGRRSELYVFACSSGGCNVDIKCWMVLFDIESYNSDMETPS